MHQADYRFQYDSDHRVFSIDVQVLDVLQRAGFRIVNTTGSRVV